MTPPVTTDSPTLIVDSLTCVKGSFEVFSKLSFTLSQGDMLYVIGKNGSGKTTLLQALAGIQKPSKGSISIDLCQISYFGHLKALKSELTSYENLCFWSELTDNTVNLELLERFGLNQLIDTLVRHLSEGQKKKLALCCSLIPKRKYWLLDEPYSSLDSESKLELANIIFQHTHNNGIAILTSHASELNEATSVLNMEDYTSHYQHMPS